MKNFKAALILSLLMVSGSSHLVSADDKVELGRRIVSTECSICHAVDKTSSSPMAKAPPFRDLPKRYDVSLLAEPLAEGIVTGHPAMPVFVFAPREIEAIIAYLKSL